jgi:hypothetical protein
MRNALVLAVMPVFVWAAPSSKPAGDNGRIYVYAQRPSAARSWLPITCGGVAVAELKQGMFFAINLPSGRHTLRAAMGVPASVDVHPGEEVFVRLDWSYQVGRPPIPELHVVRPERAREEMRFLGYIKAKKVLSLSVPMTDPREHAPLRLKQRPEK